MLHLHHTVVPSSQAALALSSRAACVRSTDGNFRSLRSSNGDANCRLGNSMLYKDGTVLSAVPLQQRLHSLSLSTDPCTRQGAFRDGGGLCSERGEFICNSIPEHDREMQLHEGEGEEKHFHEQGRFTSSESISGNHHSLGHEHDHDHEHEHEHDHAKEHGHAHAVGHSHCHGGHHHASPETMNLAQKLLCKGATAVGLAFLADKWRENLKVCIVSLCLLLLGAGVPYVVPQSIGATVQKALILPALPFTGVPACLDAAIEIAGGKINIHVLMAVAALASVCMGNPLEGGLLLAMFGISHQAEDYFTEKALGDVKSLRESHPDFALVLEPFDLASPPPFSSLAYTRTPVDAVEIGSFIFVKAGETVPVDGVVLQGRALVTVEHLTGETLPVEKVAGTEVPGGARSLDGTMVVRATKRWADSTVARIMKLTEEAQVHRPVLQRWLDAFGERYSQAVVAVSVCIALLGPLLFKWSFLSTPGVRGSLYRSLGFMVAASPCALAVAPLAYATAISACANKGILLKGGDALDALARCDTVAFDKTGTLTTGDLAFKAIEPLYGHGKNSTAKACCTPDCEMAALAVAAAMERGATHPIARAVVEHSEGMKLPSVEVENFHTVPGEGLAATVTQSESESAGPSEALLGSVEYIASSSRLSEPNIREAARASSFGVELVQAALSIDGKVTLFHFEDKVRLHATDVVRYLKRNMGMRLVMLTGDRAASAERVGRAVGIEEIYSGLKPEEKLNKVKAFSRQKGHGSGGLVMVGDGINDAPALAAASVGIVLAKRASATAVAVADVLLLRDGLDGVLFAVAKARQTDVVVKQSVALALCCIFVAALPSLLGALPLWLTVLVHEGGTLVVCANSVRVFGDPVKSWQWKETVSSVVSRVRATISAGLKRRNIGPGIASVSPTPTSS